MRKTALLELIRRGENTEVVLRPDDITNSAFAKGVVALLNLRGGRVILGVDDDGSVIGITREAVMRTNIVIDDELLNEAFSVSNAKTKKDLIHEALKEFICR